MVEHDGIGNLLIGLTLCVKQFVKRVFKRETLSANSAFTNSKKIKKLIKKVRKTLKK